MIHAEEVFIIRTSSIGRIVYLKMLQLIKFGRRNFEKRACNRAATRPDGEWFSYSISFHPSVMCFVLPDAMLPRLFREWAASPSFAFLPCRPPLWTLPDNDTYKQWSTQTQQHRHRYVCIGMWLQHSLTLSWEQQPKISIAAWWNLVI